MSPVDELRSAAALLRQRAEAATPGPWWFDEDDMCWRLHGVAFRIPGDDLIPEQVVNSQILKAPKHGTPYAEYWPNAADGAWIIAMNPLVGPLLADAMELLTKDYGGTDVGCQKLMLEGSQFGAEHPLLTLARLILRGGS